MKTWTSIIAAVLALATALHAGPPAASQDYDLEADTFDSGGGKSSSATYQNDGCTGGLAGISTATSPATITKDGYIGQLLDITGLVITADPAEVPEGQDAQLSARTVMDDGTFLALDAGDVSWDVVHGPLLSISASGLATAGLVPQHTFATVGANMGGFTDTLDINVLNILPDNFGLYAGDGLPDDWQVGHFGKDNPLAAPHVDVTGNGQTNLFSYIADLDPNDHSEVFRVWIEPGENEDQKNIIFSPRKETRNYRVIENGDLGPTGWLPVVDPIVQDDGEERAVTDPAAVEDRKFYRVEITVP